MSSPHDLDPATELPLVQGFGELAPEVMAELEPLVVQRRVASQEVIAEQGQLPAGLLLLVRGAVKAVRTTTGPQGKVARVLDVMRASCLIADAAVFDGLASEASVVALRASHLFVIDRRALQRVMAAHPSLERALFGRFLRESRLHARRVDELAAGTVEERVHRLMDALSAQYGTPLGHGRFIALPLRRRDLASMVNATTETVSRLLAQLERDGKVRSTRDGIWWRGLPRRAASPPVEAVVPASPPLPVARDGRG